MNALTIDTMWFDKRNAPRNVQLSLIVGRSIRVIAAKHNYISTVSMLLGNARTELMKLNYENRNNELVGKIYFGVQVTQTRYW